MAEVNIFHYRHGSSMLHKLDTRFKLILLLSYSTLIFKVNILTLLLLSLIIIYFFLRTILEPAGLLREMKGVFIIVVLIFTGKLLSTPGTAIHSYIPILSRQGLMAAGLASWKFLIVVLIGLIFSATTLPEDIHTAVYRILKPVPMINQSAVASKLSLTILFIPSLMDMLNEIMEARKARYIEGSKNPVKNIISLTIPVTIGIINRADETTMALESRLYDGEISGKKQTVTKKDFLVLFLGSIPIISILLQKIIINL
jgi:energy-coupling factor transporter transmembrane protein EcfT